MAVIRFLFEPFCQQLGLTLIHFLWQGLIVAAFVASTVRLFHLPHGHFRYSLYLAAFLLMALCPLLTFTVINQLAKNEAAVPQTKIVSDISVSSEEGASPTVVATPVSPPVRAMAREGRVAAPAGNPLRDWLPRIVAFWMIGVTVLSVRLLLGFVGMWRWRRNLRPLPDGLAQRIAHLSQRLGMARFTRVFISSAVRQATAIGYLRPLVLLPAAMLTQMDPAMIEAVVAHELAHIRRLDAWINLAQRIVETLLFYHPVVWWLSGRLRAEREFCCDEMAVKATGERLTYASALETAQRGSLVPTRPALALSLGQDKRSTLSRVRHILGLPSAPSDSRSWLAGVIAVLIIAILAMPTASLLTAQAEADSKPAKIDSTSMFELFAAAEAGDVKQVKALIAAGADVNAHDRDNWTALQLAAREGRLEVVRLLVEHGADVNAGAKAGWTPLLATTAKKGHTQIVKLLLDNQARVNDVDTAGYTPLYYAIWTDDEEMVKTLIAHGADVNKTPKGDYSPLVYAIWQCHAGNVKALKDAGADLNAKDRNGCTPLYWAVDEGATEIIQLLIEAGVEMSDIHRAVLEGDLARVKRLVETGTDIDTRDGIGRPLSHWALAAGQMEVFDYLLNNGADVTAAANDGSTLLFIASRKGLTDVVKLLIAKGAAVDARGNRGKTPLWVAARKGDKEICQLLIANGADVNASLNSGRTVLGDATVRGHEDVVKLLLASGADVNLNPNNYGVALQAAACYGHPALIDILIAAGADVNANTRQGTPLHLAVRGTLGTGIVVPDETVKKVIQKLLDHGADINATDMQRGCTALHIAVRNGRYEAARLLIAAGADVNAKDNQGRTPLSYAEGRYECRKVAELLRKHGAVDGNPTAETDQPTGKSQQQANDDAGALTLKLMEAAEAGDLNRVKALIANGSDVNARDRSGRTALHYAAQQGHLEAAKLLIARGTDVNAGAKAGRTPLLAATANNGHEQVVELLLDNQARVNDVDTAGYTPLYYAIWADDEETVKTLIAHGADVNKTPKGDYSPLVYAIWQWHAGNVKALTDAGADINAKDGDGWTPLYWAVDEGDPEVIKLLIDAGVRISDIHKAVLEGDLEQVKRLVESGTNVDTRDDVGRPLSHWALAAGQMEVFDYLLNNGADVTAAANNGSTLLHVASSKGLADVVQRLIAKGVSVNARTNRGDTALFVAANRGHKQVCQLLVANGADVNAALKNGRHPLGDATLRGHEDVVKLLLANGADVNLNVNNYGVALQAAACYGHPALVDILIAAGADVNANIRNGTPLHYAARAGDGVNDETVGQIVKKLLDHGADVHAKDKLRGCTSLHIAAQKGRVEAARLLLTAGADVNAEDNQGRTPLSYAEGRCDCRQVAELLRAHGARDENTGSTAETSKLTPEALAQAAAAGDLHKVKELIAQGADVNGSYGADRWTPLLAAADGGHEQVVSLLISNGADPNKGDSSGFTPLYRALFVDDVETVEALIEGGADVNKRPNTEDDPPLFYAVWQCHGAVKPLIDAGADVNAKGVGNGWTPLRHALQGANADVVKQFVGRGIEISAIQKAILEGDLAKVRQFIESGTDVDTKDEFGWTLTYWALSGGHKDVAEYLLGQGANISARTDAGDTLLVQAVRAGFADIVKELIAKGANVNATTTDGRYPLGVAAGYGHAKIVELLLPKTMNINATWSNGRCALADAALNGHKDVVELLIANGADVNLHEGGRGTALHAAVYAGHIAIADFLIAHGADIRVSARRGTALHRAVGCKWSVDEDTCAEIVDKLITAGADVNAKEPRQGDTPLHIAARKRHFQAARRLIRAGADLNVKNNNGKTPLDLVREAGIDLKGSLAANGALGDSQ